MLVEGAVNAPGAVAYVSGKNLDWYVAAAGGYAQTGDKRRTYVTQPDGSKEAVKRKALLADRVPMPLAGAVVFVPTHAPGAARQQPRLRKRRDTVGRDAGDPHRGHETPVDGVCGDGMEGLEHNGSAEEEVRPVPAI